MDEIVTSFTKYFSSRLRTQLYGLLGFWWVVFHWEFFYALFFVNQNIIFRKTGLLKNEYLKQHFYDYSHKQFWVQFLASVILTFAMTILMIWVIPRFILIRAFEREQKDRAERLKVKIKYEEDVQKERTNLEKKITQLEEQLAKRFASTEKRVVQEKKVQDADPTSKWQEEYDQLKKSQLYNDFDELVKSLYEYGGKTKVVSDDIMERTIFELDRDLLAYSDANDLISYDRSKGIISLTEKGKFFIKQYQSETTS